jgi:hypothetical protein
MKRTLLPLLLLVAVIHAVRADSLEKNFLTPPPEARPWVYWFWNNGNVTSNGITADLEAMRRVGVGGVLIMDVFERFAPPRGTAEFMNPEWQDLFQFAVQEAGRLGLEINMANGPGWCGSSGPWITPELSMQMLVSTNIAVEGPARYSAALPLPFTGAKQRHDGFDSTIDYKDSYRDIAVLAFPHTTNNLVPHESVTNLSARMDASGKLAWDVPPGSWIIQRIGHSTTGSSTRPPVAGGNGLECDKLSAEAMDAHFANMMGKLIERAGPLAGKSLTATHIDSWEVGSQNWTPKFREEFIKRRGYDPIPWLPCVTGGLSQKVKKRVVTHYPLNADSQEVADRFRWDFNQTIAELLAENYSGRLAQLAHQHGLRYSIEGYNLPFGDEFTYTARADEPMTEFWTQTRPGLNETYRKAQEMASVAHVYGRAIVGAEAFTSGDHEMWKLTPADIKALGDYEFSQGVNRFVVHRYAHQPYLDKAPGATMGPWGLHYERTQTWWELAGAWHEYLARCQQLLRQGKYVADLCYLRPELPNQGYFTPNPAPPDGYRYDEMSAEALQSRVKVKGGRLVLPDGMSYRALVLPEQSAMTPALAATIKSLVKSGATVLGPRPAYSPSLQDYPACDETVAKLGGEVWGACDGKSVTQHRFGKGQVFWGQSLGEVLRNLGVPPDFASTAKLNWIHRRDGDADIYFVANPSSAGVEAQCAFRVTGRAPEFWNPETGDITLAAAYQTTRSNTVVPLHLDPSGSLFVVFRKPARSFDPVVSFSRDGKSLFAAPKPPKIVIEKAIYGVPGDAQRTRDVRAKLQAMVDEGTIEFTVAELARGDDPAFGVVKTLNVEFTADGVPAKVSGQDTDSLNLAQSQGAQPRAAEVRRDARGNLSLVPREPGRYELTTAKGATARINLPSLPEPRELTGPWEISFPPNWGAPEAVILPKLASWSDSEVEGVKHFSGVATYTKTFDWVPPENAKPAEEFWLDLGDVKVMAGVKLNGKDLGTLWRPPYRVNVTGVLQAGKNSLEIRVANLWPNRLIGDAALPEKERHTWSSWQPFTRDMPLLPSGLLGPVSLVQISPQKM